MSMLMAALLGCSSAGIDAERRPTERAEEKLVFEDRFTDISNWQAEGPHLVEVNDGRLHVKTVDDERKVGQYVWCRRELPDDFRIEYDVTPLTQSGFFLIFFCVRGVGGEDILGPELFEQYLNWKAWRPYEDWDKYTSPPERKQYHGSRIRGYHISYRRNENANCNCRKNPGLVLVKSTEIDALLPKGKSAHVVLSKQGGRIVLKVNDRLFMDYTDTDKPWKGGRFAFRNVYESEAYYQNVKVVDLTGSPGNR